MGVKAVEPGAEVGAGGCCGRGSWCCASGGALGGVGTQCAGALGGEKPCRPSLLSGVDALLGHGSQSRDEWQEEEGGGWAAVVQEAHGRAGSKVGREAVDSVGAVEEERGEEGVGTEGRLP